MHENYDLEQLMELVQTRQFRRLRELLVNMNEVDIAEFLDELGPEETVLVFRLLPKEVAAEVFTELEDSDDQERLINALSDKELREVLDELYLDDTVDLIEDMPANLVSRILRNTDSTTRSQINQLLNYPKDSAGSIMTTEYVYLHPNATVEESFAASARWAWTRRPSTPAMSPRTVCCWGWSRCGGCSCPAMRPASVTSWRPTSCPSTPMRTRRTCPSC